MSKNHQIFASADSYSQYPHSERPNEGHLSILGFLKSDQARSAATHHVTYHLFTALWIYQNEFQLNCGFLS